MKLSEIKNEKELVRYAAEKEGLKKSLDIAQLLEVQNIYGDMMLESASVVEILLAGARRRAKKRGKK